MKDYIITDTNRTFPRGSYALEVVEYGHVPGTLSGASLRGKARKYGGWYAVKRASVEEWIKKASSDQISSGIYFNSDNHRYCRGWVDSDGNPVRIILDITD